jgi:muconolactone D-isomerase
MTLFAVRVHLDRGLLLPQDYRDGLRAAEAERARELAAAGVLRRIWRTPDDAWGNLGLWSARDEAHLDDVLLSLPLRPWMNVVTTRLSEHPSDPGGSP